ncbi:MAG: hypothetical protein ACKPEQ_05230, partial [Dolichospermum sp.]
ISILELTGRITGWGILGILVGGGTRFFVPNLQLTKALFGGTVGGVVGAIGFLLTAAVFGDITGRLSGAAILGFCIGWMIAFAEQEQLKKEPYLLVHWTPTEQTQYLLGIICIGYKERTRSVTKYVISSLPCLIKILY